LTAYLGHGRRRQVMMHPHVREIILDQSNFVEISMVREGLAE
jgi:hypothetical protein